MHVAFMEMGDCCKKVLLDNDNAKNWSQLKVSIENEREFHEKKHPYEDIVSTSKVKAVLKELNNNIRKKRVKLMRDNISIPEWRSSKELGDEPLLQWLQDSQ
jgi:hypothetical protein